MGLPRDATETHGSWFRVKGGKEATDPRTQAGPFGTFSRPVYRIPKPTRDWGWGRRQSHSLPIPLASRQPQSKLLLEPGRKKQKKPGGCQLPAEQPGLQRACSRRRIGGVCTCSRAPHTLPAPKPTLPGRPLHCRAHRSSPRGMPGARGEATLGTRRLRRYSNKPATGIENWGWGGHGNSRRAIDRPGPGRGSAALQGCTGPGGHRRLSRVASFQAFPTQIPAFPFRGLGRFAQPPARPECN